MKAPTKTSKRRERRDPTAAVNPAGLQIRVVTQPDDVRRFDQLLEDGHYLGHTRPVGDFLRQVAVLDGEWVALLAWGAASYRLKDRDEWIGWTSAQRAERLKLVVQNRRYLLLGEKGSHPNRASQVLGAAVRVLCEHWRMQFGYEPLLAETFTDLEQFEGTCYKASGWLAVGMSQGYSRHRADFYVPNNRPKRLWLKPLHPEARPRLCAAELEAEHAAGKTAAPTGSLPLKDLQLRSFMETLQQVPDPRARNSRFRIGSVLSIVAMALLCGQRDIAQFYRFGWRLKQSQRAHLGLPLKKGSRRFREVPRYRVYYDLLARVDVDTLARVLTGWLRAQAGCLPGALALDGKLIRDTIGTLSLVEHETGVPQAQAPIQQKEGESERCEMKAAQTLLANTPHLDGQVVTADALHTQRATARLIVERGGEYLLQMKANQANLLKTAQRSVALDSPLLSRGKSTTDATSNENCSCPPWSRRKPTFPSPAVSWPFAPRSSERGEGRRPRPATSSAA